jgi:hypothetical protein
MAVVKELLLQEDVFAQMQLDPQEQTPGHKIMHDMGQSLVKAMEAALATGDQEAAQRVACECVVLAEQEDEHLYHSKGWLRELSLESLGL